MRVGKIGEGAIAQGDLILMLHNEKPCKSGWWRKVRQGETGNNSVLYILEKPLHKDFSLNHPDVRNSRVEFDFCAIKSTTLREGIDGGKYTVMMDVRGFAQAFVMKHDYLTTEESIREWKCIRGQFTDDIKSTQESEDYLQTLLEIKTGTRKRKIDLVEEFAKSTI